MHGGVYFRNFTVLSMRKGNHAFLLLAVALALKWQIASLIFQIVI